MPKLMSFLGAPASQLPGQVLVFTKRGCCTNWDFFEDLKTERVLLRFSWTHPHLDGCGLRRTRALSGRASTGESKCNQEFLQAEYKIFRSKCCLSLHISSLISGFVLLSVRRVSLRWMGLPCSSVYYSLLLCVGCLQSIKLRACKLWVLCGCTAYHSSLLFCSWALQKGRYGWKALNCNAHFSPLVQTRLVF